MLTENNFIRQFTQDLPRTQRQLNKLLEADAELIRIGEHHTLAITMDNIVEEIGTGLYGNPENIGYLAVVISLSDLAAVGASPIGLLLNLVLPQSCPSELPVQLNRGIKKALEEFHTCLIGGDTNTGAELQAGSVGIGEIEGEKRLTRKGISSGDLLFASHPLGMGGYYAFTRFLSEQEDEGFYPVPQLGPGSVVRQYGSACIDTSDGFFPAISNLMEINKVGFQLDMELEELVDQDVRRKLTSTKLPVWFMLAGPHGEFELLFTIPPGNKAHFLHAAEKEGWNPIYLGKATTSQSLKFSFHQKNITCDPEGIADLFSQTGGNIREYIQMLHQINTSWLTRK